MSNREDPVIENPDDLAEELWRRSTDESRNRLKRIAYRESAKMAAGLTDKDQGDIMDASVGDEVGVRVTHQWYRGTVTEVQEDPEPYDSIEATKRLVVESGPDYTDYWFYVERTSTGRLRAIREAGPKSNVSDTEGPT